MGRDFDDEEEEEEEEDFDEVLFQGAMFGREPDLKKNSRLVNAARPLVKRMISDGLARRAHLIVLEPAQGRIAIRFVVDGVPYPAGAVPGQRGMAMIQMMKLLAGLNPQERSESQSGGINAEFDDKKYELIIDSTPLKPGVERLRIRVEDPKVSYLKPSDVGMPEHLTTALRAHTNEASGIILSCGPPESGVTSLSICALHCVDPYLYSVYNMADVGNRELSNVTDFEPEEGHDLELSLDRLIRREADIIYSGKFEDPATVQTIFDFADRLCFVGEIRANTPVDAIKQLIEWVGADKVAQHVRGILTQKLIRVLCDDCKQAFRPNPKLNRQLQLGEDVKVLYRAPAPPDPEDVDAPTIEELCEDCDGLPYHGRAACFEFLNMTDGMKDVITSGANPDAILKQMNDEKMITIRRDAVRLVVEGKTSLEEVQRSFRPPRKRAPKRRRR